jgi:ribose transport system permease protein
MKVRMMKNRIKKQVKILIKTFAFPIILWLIFALLIQLKGGENNLFITQASIKDIFQTSVLTTIIAIAVALPLSGGRWDFGVGAIMVLTAITAGNIAINYSMGLGLLFILSIGIAVVLSLFEGIIYLVFRVPTMIISLGIVMLYESLSGLIFEGSGVRLFMYPNLSILATQPYCYIVLAVVLVLFWALMKYTKFGFDSKSLGNNATLAVNNGVNEKKNILMTYLVVGILIGIASLLNASKAVVVPESNLSSTYLMFSSMGAVLVGLYLSRYSNMALGIFSGTVTMGIFSKGLTLYGMPSSLNNIILGLFIVVFMGGTTNWMQIIQIFRRNILTKTRNRRS